METFGSSPEFDKSELLAAVGDWEKARTGLKNLVDAVEGKGSEK